MCSDLSVTLCEESALPWGIFEYFVGRVANRFRAVDDDDSYDTTRVCDMAT